MVRHKYTGRASDELKESLWNAPDRATEIAILAWMERQGWVHEIVDSGQFAGELMAVRFCQGQWWCFNDGVGECMMSLNQLGEKYAVWP